MLLIRGGSVFGQKRHTCRVLANSVKIYEPIIEGVRARVGQPSIYNSCRFSFKYVLIEQTGKEL